MPHVLELQPCLPRDHLALGLEVLLLAANAPCKEAILQGLLFLVEQGFASLLTTVYEDCVYI